MSEATNTTTLEWEGPARPYKERDRSFFQTIGAIMFLLVVILFFMQGWLVIGVALAVVFVVYALATVEPSIIVYKITQKGLWVDDTFFEYSRLTQFWFEKHLETSVLVLLAPKRRNPRILLVIPTGKKKEIHHELQKKLIFREKPLRSFIDKLSDWMSRAIPLEEKKSSK